MDIDGTIRTSQKQITERTKKAIKHITEQGILTITVRGVVVPLFFFSG